MTLPPSAARKELADLVTLGLLRSRKARDNGPYRINPDLISETETPDAQLPGNGLGAKIMATLREVDDASRKEIEQATGAARSRLTNVPKELVNLGFVEATAPPRSPNRRYRAIRFRTRSRPSSWCQPTL